MFADFTAIAKADPKLQSGLSDQAQTLLVQLAEAISIRRVSNPQGGSKFPNGEKPEVLPIEHLLDEIAARVGIDLVFPNPFPDEFGLLTSRGLASYRAVQALYQAWRIKQLSSQYGGRVIEVGAGLGRTAYYAYLMGVTNYTIIDLPMTNIAQANFLGRALSLDRISVLGEAASDHGETIRILPVSEMNNIGTFDIMVNVDSLTEMGPRAMADYAKLLVDKGKVLWSVNHEANDHIVSELQGLVSIGRFPYWLRPGYVDEIFVPQKN